MNYKGRIVRRSEMGRKRTEGKHDFGTVSLDRPSLGHPFFFSYATSVKAIFRRVINVIPRGKGVPLDGAMMGLNTWRMIGTHR